MTICFPLIGYVLLVVLVILGAMLMIMPFDIVALRVRDIWRRNNKAIQITLIALLLIQIGILAYQIQKGVWCR